MSKQISQVGINLIKAFEGCRLNSYKCQAGILTIGYGHTGLDVKTGQTITLKQAEELLVKDLQKFVKGVNEAVKTEITQNQFDALVSFAYNCGLGALRESTLLKLVNKKQFEAASLEFAKWNKGGGKVLAGLTRRRKTEHDLFIKEMK